MISNGVRLTNKDRMLNLRKGPDEQTPILEVLEKNTVMIKVGEGKEDYIRVRLDGRNKIGFVSTKYVEVIQNGG